MSLPFKPPVNQPVICNSWINPDLEFLWNFNKSSQLLYEYFLQLVAQLGRVFIWTFIWIGINPNPKQFLEKIICLHFEQLPLTYHQGRMMMNKESKTSSWKETGIMRYYFDRLFCLYFLLFTQDTLLSCKTLIKYECLILNRDWREKGKKKNQNKTGPTKWP